MILLTINDGTILFSLPKHIKTNKKFATSPIIPTSEAHIQN